MVGKETRRIGMNMAKVIRLKIQRQKDRSSAPHWESFEIPYMENMNVISSLMELRKNPVTVEGKSVEPPAWEAACLEEVCGTCTMIVNGMIRQACSAQIDEVANKVGDAYEVELKPMSKFPLIRDLIVDRSKMFENLIKVKAWVPIDGSYDLGMAQPQDDNVRKLRYKLSQVYELWLLHGSLPAGQRAHQLYRPRRGGPGASVQPSPGGSGLGRRPPGSDD
jgi:succinate dehydrogenase / fumarate reductase iron-sulfur subunit